MADQPSSEYHFSQANAIEYIATVLLRENISDQNAQSVARALVNAEIDGPQWSGKNDTRITKLGKILRKYRLDELPQLISVIKGEMSLIGPRPERPEIEKLLKEKIPHYNLRNLVKPGISGWAQVNYHYGANLDDSINKLSYDIYYVKNFSLALDLIILFKTLKIIFQAKGSQPKT